MNGAENEGPQGAEWVTEAKGDGGTPRQEIFNGVKKWFERSSPFCFSLGVCVWLRLISGSWEIKWAAET